MPELKLTLYVGGDAIHSQHAKRIIQDASRALVEQGRDVELDIIDVYENPELAHERMIVALPVLVREVPAPERRLLGNLSDTEMVWDLLGLEEKPNHA